MSRLGCFFFPPPFTLLFLTRAGATASHVEQLEAPEEVDQARLKCLQSWTEKRLDTVVITVLGREGDGYRLLCELVAPSFNQNVICWQFLLN